MDFHAIAADLTFMGQASLFPFKTCPFFFFSLSFHLAFGLDKPYNPTKQLPFSI
jgi:hypothetical protein